MTDRTAERLEAFLSDQPVVDCHEHTFLPDAVPATVDLGVLIANSDIGDDMISAGMPADERQRLDWERAAPWLERVRNTGFHRSLIEAFAALFDYDRPAIESAADWDALSARLVAANRRPDWYEEVLTRRGRIERIVRIAGDEPDPLAVPRRFFAPVIRLDPWVIAASDHDERRRLAGTVGGSAATLGGYLEALDAAIARARAGGAVGAKSMLAYRRDLAFSLTPRDEAERLFAKATLDAAEARRLEDFLFHAVTGRAGAHGLPYQIHVGYGSWQTNITARANPLQLNELIEAQRGTTFVLLHGGYPFIGEMATLAKNHPNVHLECGWLAYIAPAAYRRAMAEWLDAVPATKLLAVGADCLHVEQTLGALILTRRQLALTLADKVADSGWPLTLAQDVGSRLLGGNGAELYSLDGGGDAAAV